jgi:hypothetical protein
MKIKHQEIEISKENPFANCKLGREPFAKILSDIVNTYADGFVLAINNEWGTGKTTFVKMWQQQLNSKGFQTIYFNAWENDFDSNPLVALMSELQTLTNSKNKKVFKSVIEKGAVLVKNIVPTLTKSLIKKYVVDLDEIAIDAIENSTKASTEILEEKIKEYSSKKKTIVEFRKELGKFVKQADNSKPLIFIIDELDRCRPNYAVEVLEQIKHFFSVKGIVFVLSIDKKHLGASIKGVYGSEEINTEEYLRRFIDLEYSIPIPTTADFVKYLFEYYNFSDFFSNPLRLKFQQFRKDSDVFLRISEILLTKNNLTLRQQERIFAMTRLILCSFESNQFAFPLILFLLIYIKFVHNDFFNQIEKNELNLQDLNNSIAELILQNIHNSKKLNVSYVEALFLWLYNNNEQNGQSEILILNDDGSFSTSIQSKISDSKELTKNLVSISNQEFADLDLSFLIKKINLTEPLLFT